MSRNIGRWGFQVVEGKSSVLQAIMSEIRAVIVLGLTVLVSRASAYNGDIHRASVKVGLEILNCAYSDKIESFGLRRILSENFFLCKEAVTGQGYESQGGKNFKNKYSKSTHLQPPGFPD
jgi:hypothetical protein